MSTAKEQEILDLRDRIVEFERRSKVLSLNSPVAPTITVDQEEMDLLIQREQEALTKYNSSVNALSRLERERGREQQAFDTSLQRKGFFTPFISHPTIYSLWS
jgi:hypothetical protein